MATEEIGVKLSVRGRREAARALRDTADDIGKVDRKLDGIDGSARKAERALDRAARAGRNFGKGIGIAAGVGIAAGAAGLFALGRAASGWVSGAAESARVSRLTDAAIKSTGGVANVTAAQIGSLAEAISNKTGLDDEMVQGASNLLLTFTKVRNEVGKGNDVFNQATQAAADMSVALGVDMEAGALQLGKALNDPIRGVTALGRAGVSFTQQQKDQIKTLVESGKTLDAQKIILKEMTTQFGGAAEAAADPMQKLRTIIDNVGERIGFMLLPHVERFSRYLIDRAVPAVHGFLDEFDRGIGVGGRFRDKLTELRDMGVQLWNEFRTGTGTGGDLRDALATAGDAAKILGEVTRDVILPAIAWFADHPDALQGLVLGMAAFKAHAIVAAAATASIGAFAGRGGATAAGKGRKGTGVPSTGTRAGIGVLGGPWGVAAAVVGGGVVAKTIDDARNGARPVPGQRPNVDPVPAAPGVPPLFPAVPMQAQSASEPRTIVVQSTLNLDGRAVAQNTTEHVYAEAARK